MIEWFLLNRIHILGDQVAINSGIEPTPMVLTHPADACAALADLASMSAEMTLDLFFLKLIE